MAQPEYFVFVCSQQRPPGHPRGSCGEHGAGGLLQELYRSVSAHNLLQTVSVVPTACLGPCGVGANLLVFPGAVMYSGVQTQDIDGIVEQHLQAGQPVQEKRAPAQVW